LGEKIAGRQAADEFEARVRSLRGDEE